MLSDVPGNKLNIYTDDYCIFDLETTGISPKKDEVIEISAIKVKGGEVVDEFSTLVNPGIPIPYRASMVNGIYDDMVADAPSMEEALADFSDFVEDMILIGHNIHVFDMKFIWRDARKYFGKTIGNDYIDTLPIAYRNLPGLPHHTLIALAEHYNISSDGAHRALNDCRMNQQVYEYLKKEAK